MSLFQFNKDDVTRHIQYELKTLSKFKEPFNYIVKTLEDLGHSLEIKSLDKIDLNKVKENEGKNYHWSVFKHKNVTLLVRRYGHHLTIFTKTTKFTDHESDGHKWTSDDTEYGAFTLNTNFEHFGDRHDEMMDMYWDAPFTSLNSIAKDLFVLLDERGVHWVWNSASLKRDKHIDIKLVFKSKVNNDSIHSIDSFIFCMEEIDSIFLSLFAETTMLKKIATLTEGEQITDRLKIKSIKTEVKDEYYHAVGITFLETTNNNKENWCDVYSLTRWYFDTVFQEPIIFHEGKVYVDDPKGKLKSGAIVRFKDQKLRGKAKEFQESYPEENFVALKEL